MLNGKHDFERGPVTDAKRRMKSKKPKFNLLKHGD